MHPNELSLIPAKPDGAFILRIGGGYVRLGVCEPVSLDELTDTYARACRELSYGATLGPLTMGPRDERVTVPVVREDGTLDIYSLARSGSGGMTTCYWGTWTADGDRKDRY